MPGKITKLTCVAIAAFALLFTIGFDALPGAKKNPTWSEVLKIIEEHRAKTKKVSTEKVKQIFSTHFALMEKVVDLCVRFPAIRRVEIGQVFFMDKRLHLMRLL